MTTKIDELILTPKKTHKSKRKPVHWGTAIFLVVWSIYVLIPFFIMFSLATKTRHESTYMEYSIFWKEGFTLEAFNTVFEDTGLGCTVLSGFFNTLKYSIPTVLIGLFVGSMAAYAWAKLKWHGRDFIFKYMMIGMMMPSCVSMTTRFLMYDSINWVGTPLPLMIPGMFCGIAQIFFIKQYMVGIPDELLDAGKMDGMKEYGAFFKIVLPLSLPAIFTQILFCFIGSYNDYLGPLIYLDDPATYTLQIALRFHQSAYFDYTAAVMAASFIASIPLMLLYILLQKYILTGLNMGSGLKG